MFEYITLEQRDTSTGNLGKPKNEKRAETPQNNKKQ